MIDAQQPATAALLPRSSRPEVRNPILAMPCAARVQDMPPEARAWLVLFLQDLRKESRAKAALSWRTHKAPLALYHKVVAVWASHLIQALRRAQQRPEAG